MRGERVRQHADPHALRRLLPRPLQGMLAGNDVGIGDQHFLLCATQQVADGGRHVVVESVRIRRIRTHTAGAGMHLLGEPVEQGGPFLRFDREVLECPCRADSAAYPTAALGKFVGRGILAERLDRHDPANLRTLAHRPQPEMKSADYSATVASPILDHRLLPACGSSACRALRR
jgi:hypothetical protein